MRHLFSPAPQPPLEIIFGFFYYFSCQLSLIFVIVNQPFLSAVWVIYSEGYFGLSLRYYRISGDLLSRHFLKYLDDIQSSTFFWFSFFFFFFLCCLTIQCTISNTITKCYQISHIKNKKLTANTMFFSSNIVTLALHLPPFPSSFCTYYYFLFLLYL